MIRHLPSILLAAVLGTWPLDCEAVIFVETGDAQHNTNTPGDNSGWQYEGKFMNFLGVPISPNHFITAKHIGGTVGTTFDFHGDIYTTIAVFNSPSTDLAIWEVEGTKLFPTYAPLSSGAADIGANAAIFGRGTLRGDLVTVSGQDKGWKWGTRDYVKRWGRNIVEGTFDGGPSLGELLYCNFSRSGVLEECHLSVGDSGGGLFVLENGLWRLAGIHYAVDGPFREPPEGPSYQAALLDMGGLEFESSPSWTAVPDTVDDVPSRFYSSRISASLPWISGIVPQVSSLASENFSAWTKLYFTPSQISSLASEPLVDTDEDGISNILEFAFNLDPTFSERVTMTANSGISGLPILRVEPDGNDDRLTIEFVRRTAGSGAGLTYTHQFSNDLVNWESVGSVTVTAINSRWERVKIVDSETTTSAPHRFSRIKVVVD